MAQLFPLVLLLAGAPGGQKMTEAERQEALRQLRESRVRFLSSIGGVSQAQWRFKPAPDRWSVGECAEHIVLTEQSYFETLTRLLAAKPPAEKQTALSDAELSRLYTDRGQKRQAPEKLQPTGRWSRAELVERFNRTRDRIIAIAETTDAPLRSYTSAAAAGNKMDGYQWFLRIAGHVERHTAQLEEVKAHPDYPKR